MTMKLKKLWEQNNYYDTPPEDVEGIFRATLYNESLGRDYGYVELQKSNGIILIYYYEKHPPFFRAYRAPMVEYDDGTGEEKFAYVQATDIGPVKDYKGAINVIEKSGYQLQPGWEKVDVHFSIENNSMMAPDIRVDIREDIDFDPENSIKVESELMLEMIRDMNRISKNAAYTGRVKAQFLNRMNDLKIESFVLNGIIRFRYPHTYGHWGFVSKENIIGYTALVKVEDEVEFSIYDQITRQDIAYGALINLTVHFMDAEGIFCIKDNEYQSDFPNKSEVVESTSKSIVEEIANGEYNGGSLTKQDVLDTCYWITGFIGRSTGDYSLEKNDHLLNTSGGDYFCHLYACLAGFLDIVQNNEISLDTKRSINLFGISLLEYIKDNDGHLPYKGNVDVWTRRGKCYVNLEEYDKAIDVYREGLEVYKISIYWEPGKLSEMDKQFNCDPSKVEIIMARLCECYYLKGDYDNCVKSANNLLHSIGIRGHQDYKVPSFPKGVRYFLEKAKEKL